MVKVDSLMRFWTWNCSAILWLLAGNPAIADIVPDTTLPTNTTVSNSGNVKVIQGGTLRGTNLFHSFQEFSFSVNTAATTGDTAFFNNDAAVSNIFARVTGGSISNIDGVIRANGLANLFLINPSGIIFGPNASLNVGGSFVASTANSIKFADGQEFSATNPNPNPLLTVSIPVGLDFNSNVGRIVNQSQASPNGEVTDAFPPNPIGLKAAIGKTLALIGGEVAIEGGNLTTTAGSIELASVSTGLVKLTDIAKGYAFDYSGVQDFGQLQVSQFSIIYGSGNDGSEIHLQGGDIKLTDSSLVFINSFGEGKQNNLSINAKNLTIDGGAFLATFAVGEGDAGNIQVKASETVDLAGTTPDGFFPSGIASQVLEAAEGNAGNVTLEAKNLLIRDGAILDSSTFGFGQAGNVSVKASDSIELRGTTINGLFPSGIFAIAAQSSANNSSNGGNITLESQKLSVVGGAQISAVTRNSGTSGNIDITASDAILVSGTGSLATASPFDSYRSGIFVSAQPGATGSSGNLNIKTRLLTVENGARITASNVDSLQGGGNATFDLSQLLVQNGGEIRADSFGKGPGGTLNIKASDSVEVVGVGNIGGESVISRLSTQAQASGNAGNLIVNSDRLSVRDGAELTVSSKGSGQAGNLEVTARRVLLDNQGKLIAETASGNGGNIKLTLDESLVLRRNSLISTTAGTNFAGGNGGIINIQSPLIVAIPSENSDIRANAFTGNGGQVNITTRGIFGIQPRLTETPKSDITASSTFGINGVININNPDVDPSQGLVNLPESVVDISNLIAQGCNVQPQQPISQLVVTGRGGMPPSPNDSLSDDTVWSDTRLTNAVKLQPPVATTTAAPIKTPNTSVVPASSWMFNNKGEVTLIAHVPNATLDSIGTNSTTCRNP
ncbi:MULTISPECIES: filamentous hemagglutinin N-terminal domain-containing protein [unclassified Nostoc]|uniref:two-partner secretion domain-containing protein n=1 Tax=unclassified Nostoc TaxID=2593658 RepID=UPI0028C4A75D|nr:MULTISPECIES: filamentous hemagglutinin N-terminal domain-containing protein [unclassified Nostoc]